LSFVCCCTHTLFNIDLADDNVLEIDLWICEESEKRDAFAFSSHPTLRIKPDGFNSSHDYYDYSTMASDQVLEVSLSSWTDSQTTEIDRDQGQERLETTTKAGVWSFVSSIRVYSMLWLTQALYWQRSTSTFTSIGDYSFKTSLYYFRRPLYDSLDALERSLRSTLYFFSACPTHHSRFFRFDVVFNFLYSLSLPNRRTPTQRSLQRWNSRIEVLVRRNVEWGQERVQESSVQVWGKRRKGTFHELCPGDHSIQTGREFD